MTGVHGPIGVVLLNLGAPEDAAHIPGFIRRLLSDPDVVPLPWPLRHLVGFVASRRRAGFVADHYAAMGGQSPLFAETRSQVEQLRARLGPGHVVRFAFRHSNPFANAVVDAMVETGVRRVVALPGYPQYSRSTTGSGLADLRRAARRHGLAVHEVRSYPDAPGYVEALAAGLLPLVEPDTHVLFTAHGLPMRTVRAGDPYVGEVGRTVSAVAARLPATTPHSLAYQSRVGRMAWTGPSLPDELRRLATAGVRSVVVVPVSFVCENLETLYELDLEHAALAREAGISLYRRAPAPGSHPAFMDELAAQVRTAVRAAGWLPEPQHG
jgi:ferrochelatase